MVMAISRALSPLYGSSQIVRCVSTAQARVLNSLVLLERIAMLLVCTRFESVYLDLVWTIISKLRAGNSCLIIA